MAIFEFNRQSIAANSETEIGYFTNSSSGPYFKFAEIEVTSPSGCSAYVIRIYKNTVLFSTYYNSFVNNRADLTKPIRNLVLEPGSNLKITVNNLDPLSQSHNFEGQLS